jgi:integrase/recombinase XerC
MNAITRANEREIIHDVVVERGPMPLNGALARPGQGRISTQDLLAMLLRDKRSTKTREAYDGDLKHHYLTRELPCTREEVVYYLDTFIAWPRADIAFRLNEYKALMIEGEFAEATVARRLAASKAFLKLAHRFNRCETDGRGLVDVEKVRSYRETHGVTVEQVKALLALPITVHGLGSVAALRDEAMLRLMAQSGLRRAEVLKLEVGDFSIQPRAVRVLGKGRGTQKELVPIPQSAADAIGRYLQATGRLGVQEGALFLNLDHRPAKTGQGLTMRAMNWIVEGYGTRLGIELRPHMLRHTFGTQLSLKTSGDVPAVQKAMRHADANTTLRYIENSKNIAGKMVDLLTEVYD